MDLPTTLTASAVPRLVLIACVILLTACVPSVIERDPAAGFNGSYETVRSGLPVNWYVYRAPVEDGSTELSFDRTDVVEGKQSLKFVVHSASPERTFLNPGLFQVVPAKENTTYRVSFWLKSQEATVRVFIRSEKPNVSPPPDILLLGAAELSNTWQRFEHLYTIPEDHNNLRFELDILAPGTLWLDDVRIEEVPEG